MDYEQARPFTAVINADGIIYEYGVGRQRTAVGIDLQKENEYVKQIAEMQEVIDNYYNKLIELGEIVPPKSVEQIALEQQAEQKEINLALLDAISNLQNEIKVMKGGNPAPEIIDVEPAVKPDMKKVAVKK